MEVSLEKLLMQLMSSDNNIRSQAEQLLESEWTNSKPDALLCNLALFIKNNPDNATRSLSAILLRRISMRPSGLLVEKNVWDVIAPDNKRHIQDLLLQSFASEQQATVRNKICDTISDIALFGQNDNQSWPELFDTLAEASVSLNAEQRESALRILESIPELMEPRNYTAITKILSERSSDTDALVQLAAIKAISRFIVQCCAELRNSLKQLIPQMFNLMFAWKKSKESSMLTKAFTAINEVAESFPKLFVSIFSNLIEFGVSLINDDTLEDSCRQAALEFLITLSEGISAEYKKDKKNLSLLVESCLKLMVSVGGDASCEAEELEEWLNTDNVGGDDETCNHIVADQALDRLARKVGGRYIIPPAFKYIPAMISSQNWKARHAALMAISSIAEGCDKVMLAELDRVLDMIFPMVTDKHPRVRWAAANVLGQMSTDFAPDIEEKYSAKVLPALLSLLDSPEPRVQAHAAAACVNFAEEATNEIIAPYLDTLFEKLMKLLSSEKRYVQEQAVTTIATIADAAEQKFEKYYDLIMPLLVNVLKQAQDKQYRTLRGKTIECTTLIALAVGRERFSSNLQEIVQILANIQVGITDDDDPQASYLLTAWGRICRIMGDDFIPLLPSIMQPLLKMAKAKPDFTIFDEETDDQEALIQDGWDLVPLHGQQIGIKTSTLEDRCTATEMLVCYSSELKKHFDVYTNEVVQDILIPGLRFYFHDGVRAAAAKLVPLILNVRKLASDDNLSSVSSIWNPIFEKLLDIITIEPSAEMLSDLYQSLYESIEVLGTKYVSENHLEAIMKATESQLLERLKISAKRQEDASKGEIDIDEDEDVIREIEEDENLLSEINKTLHVFAKQYGANYLKYWQKFIPIYETCIQSRDENLVQWAICGFDDIIEFCSPDSLQYQQLIVKALADGLSSSSANIRQAASYGFGVAALRGGEGYAQICTAAIPALFNFFQMDNARDEDNIYATENACIAIAKILRFNNSQVPDLDNYIFNWVQTLPVTNDESDAPYAYAFLGELFNSNHSAVKSQVEKSFSAVVAVLEAKILSKPITEVLVKATKEFLSKLDNDTIQKLIKLVDHKSQDTVLRYFN